MSKSKGAGFVADNWLENDGDAAAQAAAYARGAFLSEKGRVSGQFGEFKVLQISGKTALKQVGDGCIQNDIVISSLKVAAMAGCEIYDQTKLRATGSVAIYQNEKGTRTVTAAEREGARLWSPLTKKKRRSRYAERR